MTQLDRIALSAECTTIRPQNTGIFFQIKERETNLSRWPVLQEKISVKRLGFLHSSVTAKCYTVGK